jgi:hypothetical protein
MGTRIGCFEHGIENHNPIRQVIRSNYYMFGFGLRESSAKLYEIQYLRKSETSAVCG